jgi:hypothetical protein
LIRFGLNDKPQIEMTNLYNLLNYMECDTESFGDVLVGVQLCTSILCANSERIGIFSNKINEREDKTNKGKDEIEKRKEAQRQKQEEAKQKIHQKFQNLRNKFASSFLEDEDDESDDENENDNETENMKEHENENENENDEDKLEKLKSCETNDLVVEPKTNISASFEMTSSRGFSAKTEKEIRNLLWRKYSKFSFILFAFHSLTFHLGTLPL